MKIENNKKCKTCWKVNPAEIHTCTPGLYFSREEKIDAIYEKIADKTLSFGCRVKLPKEVCHPDNTKIIERIDKCHPDATRKYVIYYTNPSGLRFVDEVSEDIPIWHPIMIWDVLDWIEKNPQSYEADFKVLHIWENKRKPLEEQSDDCIDYIYNLLELWEK